MTIEAANPLGLLGVQTDVHGQFLAIDPCQSSYVSLNVGGFSLRPAEHLPETSMVGTPLHRECRP
jgi:hypothetical protein